MGQEPIPLLEPAETDIEKMYNPFTGFTRDPEPENEDDALPLTEITGIVRKGEEEDILNGRRNWKKEGVYTYIDLDFMSRFFRLYNHNTSKLAYIERIVPSYEDQEEELYPVPASI